MEAQTVMMTLQVIETFAKKQQEEGLTKEESLTYDKMLVAVGNYMKLTSILIEKQINRFEESDEELGTHFGCDGGGEGNKNCDRGTQGDQNS